MRNLVTLLVLWTASTLNISAQEIISPAIKTTSTFAIIVDNETFQAAKSEILAYKNSIEKDGLGTYVISHSWSKPEEIRNILKELYNQKKSPIEGTVLIGKIPVPMIREAQYLTSTFKMNEAIRWDRSSVPSDRYYDDFDLEFDFLRQDEGTDLFYYKIKPESAQHIEMDIYSARIKPPYSKENDNTIEQIKTYLAKVVEEKKNVGVLDQMIVSTAHGYNSNSTISWAGEITALRTTFPKLFQPGNSIKFLNYRNADFLKKNLLSELKRDELDLAFMTGHGTATLQLLNGYPDASSPQPSMENVGRYIRSKMRNALESKRDTTKVKEGFQSTLGLNNKWFNDAFSAEKILEDSLFNDNLDLQIRDLENINARIAYINSCLTGSFQLTDYLAAHYPFSGGKNILAFANSVGVLQDLYNIQLLGILQHGVRAGHLLKKTAYLETHIFGDPTYHFKADNSDKYNLLFGSKNAKAKDWKKMLNQEDADLQAYALTELFKVLDAETFSKQLVKLLKESPYESVRTQSYLLLRSYQNQYFREAIQLALNDNYEYLRRKAIYDINELGDDEWIPATITTYIANQEARRILYKTDWTLQFLNHDVALREVEIQIKNNTSLVNSDELYDKLVQKLSYEKTKTEKNREAMFKANATDKELMAELRTLRAYRYHLLVPSAITIALDTTKSDEVRITALEVLSWFGMSYQKTKITETCHILLKDNVSETLKAQSKKTINVLNETSKRPF